ncbi:MAG: Glu-tRNA(Gln) amidotransferase subunit GatD [Candidatus Diapherotrites archaeon]|nr:Glu-tRNA(Gln) amidotransferase subunit GatD [Candidatus Diapherotrites archaeon]
MKINSFLKKHKLQEGDIVELWKDSEKFKGTILPSEGQILNLKLSNGYNAGFKISNIKKIKKLGKGLRPRKPKARKLRQRKDLPTISILHTGGTIASRVDYRTGAVITSFEPEDLLSMFPQLGEIANYNSKLISNMFSEDMRFRHYTLIANAIARELKKDIEGIIIAHGTDTMHYSSAALAFALEDLPLPVLLVGAQRSSDRGSSDAMMNLSCAANFIANSEFAGVAICMHSSTSDDYCSILPACKTRKMHTSRRDAFKAINAREIARVYYKTNKIEFIAKEFMRKDKKRKLKLRDRFEEKVALLKIHPNLMPEQIAFFRERKYKGLIIEGTGLGHAPINVTNEFNKIHRRIFAELKKLVEDGCVVGMTSQCLFGRVNMNVYSTGRDLQSIGVIPCEDMLPEVALVKLSWLLGNFNKEKARELLNKNLRGEISSRTSLYYYPW